MAMARAKLIGKVAVLVTMVFYCLVVEGALTCEQVISDISPCATYLINGGTISTDCCNGVKLLNSVVTTIDDRQTVCKCSKQAATTVPGVNPDNVRSLPAKCGVKVDFDFDPSADCSKVH